MSLTAKLAFLVILLNLIGDVLAVVIFERNQRVNAKQEQEKSELEKTIRELKLRLAKVEMATAKKKRKIT